MWVYSLLVLLLVLKCYASDELDYIEEKLMLSKGFRYLRECSFNLHFRSVKGTHSSIAEGSLCIGYGHGTSSGSAEYNSVI